MLKNHMWQTINYYLLQYDVNREPVKIFALSPGKIDKYEVLTGKEILPADQDKTIEKAKFTYFPVGKAFEKYSKSIEDRLVKSNAFAQKRGTKYNN